MRPPNQPNRERGGEIRSEGRERERAVRQGCGHQINRQGRREERRIEEKKRERKEKRGEEKRERAGTPQSIQERARQKSLCSNEKERRSHSIISLSCVCWPASSLGGFSHPTPFCLPLPPGPFYSRGPPFERGPQYVSNAPPLDG